MHPDFDNLPPTDVERFLAAGGRLVFYEICISLIVVTWRRPSRVVALPPGSRGILRGLPYSLVTLVLGWWGVPWGFIYTPLVLLSNTCGGCDISAQVRTELGLPAQGALN